MPFVFSPFSRIFSIHQIASHARSVCVSLPIQCLYSSIYLFACDSCTRAWNVYVRNYDKISLFHDKETHFWEPHECESTTTMNGAQRPSIGYTYHNKQVCIVIDYVNSSDHFAGCVQIATHHHQTAKIFEIKFQNITILFDVMATGDVLQMKNETNPWFNDKERRFYEESNWMQHLPVCDMIYRTVCQSHRRSVWENN